MNGTRYAILLTLLITALAGQRALVRTQAAQSALPPDRTQSSLVALARQVAWRLTRVRQSRPVSLLSPARRISAYRLVHAVRELLSAGFIPARLSPLQFRLPPPAAV